MSIIGLVGGASVLSIFLLQGPGRHPCTAGCETAPCWNPPCCNGDSNADGAIDISDAIYLLFYIFAGGPAPVALAGSGGAWSSQIYVHSERGSDDSPGTLDRPVASLSAALRLLPEGIASPVTIHVGAGIYTTTGGLDMPPSNLVLSRSAGQILEARVTFVGESTDFSRPAVPGEVVFDWPSTPLVMVRGGEWGFENIQFGTRSYPNSQSGIIVSGSESFVLLKDVRIRTGSHSGPGIQATRGGEVQLYGAIELNEDLHESAPAGTFCGIIAAYNGIVRCRDGNGTLSVGNGSLSAGYYGVIELGCKTAAITSWGDQSNCLAINDSGRIDLHGTEITLAAKMEGNTEIGLEDDGHILAENARIVIRTQSGFNGSIVLQKSSTLYGGPIVVEGPSACRIATMSGSNFVGSSQGNLDRVDADTGGSIVLSYRGDSPQAFESRGGKVFLSTW